ATLRYTHGCHPGCGANFIWGGTAMRDMNRSLAIALGLFTATIVSGCGSGTSAPTPPPPPPVAVSVSPTSASIPVNATQQFTATLQNDPSNKGVTWALRSEEHTSELQSLRHLVCRLLLEKKKS